MANFDYWCETLNEIITGSKREAKEIVGDPHQDGELLREGGPEQGQGTQDDDRRLQDGQDSEGDLLRVRP